MTVMRIHLLAATALVGMALASPTLAQAVSGFALAPAKTEEKQTTDVLSGDEGQLRRVVADKQDLFFGGETESREFPFFVLPSEMTGPAKFILTFQTAISVAPERSAMRVFVNDREVGTAALRSGDPRQMAFDLPRDILQPGYNSLVILTDQSHRVDCSIDATYELWTQVDPAKTGFIFPRSPADKIDGMPIVLANSRDVNGRVQINSIVPAGASSTDVDRTMLMVQSLAIRGQFDRTAVTFSNKAGTGPGIDLVVGSYGTVRDALGTGQTPSADGVAFEFNPDTGRSRVIATAATAEQLGETIGQFISESISTQPDGSAQGQRALENRRGRLLGSGSQATLSSLGFISRPFAGRRFDQSVSFNLPADFYPGNYGAASLRLDADYAAGLSPDAKLTVRANGQTVAVVQLGEGRSGRIQGQELPIPLDKLRPGLNTLQFDADLHAAADEACDPATLMNPTTRFHIKDSSSLQLPMIGQVGHSPDMAVMAAGGKNLGTGARSDALPLFVQNQDLGSLGAAATFLAKSAYTSRSIYKVATTSSWPMEKNGPLLAVGTFAQLGERTRGDMALDLSASADDLSAIGVAVPALDMADQTGAESSAPSLDLSGAEQVAAPQLGLRQQVEARARSMVDSVVDRARNQAMRLRLIDNPELLADGEVYQISPKTDLLLSQRLVSDKDAWTVIAGRDQKSMQDALATLTQSANWAQIGGAVNSFTLDGELIDRRYSERETLYETAPVSLKNGRLIVAGWFSNHAREFTLAQIGAAILLGFATFFLLRSGRRSR